MADVSDPWDTEIHGSHETIEERVIDTPWEDVLSVSFVKEAFARVERHGLRVDKILCNPNEYRVFRNAGRDYVDFETQRELLRTGFMGSVYGASIFQSVEVPEGYLFVLTEPEYLAVMPVRIDLTVIPADDPVNRAFGWSIFEQIGIGVHNSEYGLNMIQVNY